MSKNVATPKQTGGGGFTFEDKVSASFLRQMLSGEPPLESEVGQATCLAFQKRVDGWHLDDLVLSLESKGGACSAAISVKSNAQISDQGFPDDFAQAVWEQRLHLKTTQFDVARDFLVLITSPIESKLKRSWESLLNKAIDADVDKFAHRLTQSGYANEQERTLFASLRCPATLDKSKTDRDVTELLKRIRHFELDFENVSSKDENSQIARSRDLLLDGSLTSAEALWGELKAIARRFATSGGDLSRRQLGDLLRSKFSLREFPETKSDWLKIAADFHHEVALVIDSLGGKAVLPRKESRSISTEGSITALVGASGTGKSAIAKQCAIDVAATGHAIWLNARTMNAARPTTLLSELGLAYRLLDLVSDTLISRGLLVVDGVERLSEQGVGNLCALMEAARIGDGSPWSVVMTCVVEQWESVLRGIGKHSVLKTAIDVVQMEFSFPDYREVVEKSFPNLAQAFKRPHLRKLFNNLKVLDVIVSNAGAEDAAERWIGETDVVDWYWDNFALRDGALAHSRLLQKLACKEADEFQDGIALADLESSECEIGTALVSQKLIAARDERLTFSHDMLADWARSRFLLSKENEIVSVARDKVVNPRWHRAIRLYGLRLLEDERHGVEKWEALIGKLEPSGKFTLEGDIVLESIIFAADAGQKLQQVWPVLLHDGGGRLARLLTRFLHVGTMPDPRFDFSSSVALAAAWRIPFWPVWPAMLQQLHRQRHEIMPVALRQLSQIAHDWILYAHPTWSLRHEAAEILFDAANYVVDGINRERYRFDSDHAKHVFELLPVVASVYPDETAELILKLAERGDESPFAFEKPNEVVVDAPTDDSLVFADEEIARAVPWPMGPRRDVNRRVQEGLLSATNPLQHLFSVRPDAANEALLALLIREPLLLTASGRRYRGYGSDEFLHLEAERDWSPPMYFHGPFLTFLQISPEKAIDVIVTLVDFATNRWVESQQDAVAPLMVGIENHEQAFLGSWEVYFWYRSVPGVNDVLSCALMALEKWFYDALAEEKDIESLIYRILRTTGSVALLGVLVACGRRHPHLFKSSLRELVPVWQLQLWEEKYRIEQLDATLGMTMMQWTRWGEAVWNKVRDFHALPHRQQTLGEVLFRQFLADIEMRSYLSEIRGRWETQLPNVKGSEHYDFVEKISLHFDERNWRARQTSDGVQFEYVEPAEVTARRSDTRKELQQRMALLSFPHRCRSILDEKRRLNEEELSQLWALLHQLAALKETDPLGAQKVADSVMGGIAVVYLLHLDWLSEDAERMSWCIAQFNNVLDEPPPPFNIPESLSNDHWENFAALLAITLLGEDLSHIGTRAMCAQYALAYRYNVLRDVMAEAFRLRNDLGDDFLRLQHLVLKACGLREVHIVTHGGNSLWGTPDIPFDLGEHFNALTNSFVDGSLSAVRSSLAEIAEATNLTIFQMLDEQRKKWSQEWNADARASVAKRVERARGFEPHMLQAGFHWLDRIGEVGDQAERSGLIETIAEFLKAFLRPLGDTAQVLLEEEDEQRSFYRQPCGGEMWLFEVIAAVLPQTLPADKSERLWEPVLALGMDRDFWVQQFLSTFFIHGIRIEGATQSFFRVWRQMIAFAWDCESWRTSPVRGKWNREKLFRYLMGFGMGGTYFEDSRFAPFVTAMKPEFERWARHFLRHDESIRSFAHMLVRPAAAGLRRDGITWIAEAVPTLPESAWDDENWTANALMTLIEQDWSENSTSLRADPSLRQPIVTVVKKLCDLQIPRAFEFQDRMSQ